LLVIDGHESYNSLEFNKYYTENNIITLYIPLYSSYLLQPLNISYFIPLKAAYGREVEDLIYNYINYITNLEFLMLFYDRIDLIPLNCLYKKC
jgi:DDE superfamily endonuclease